jgi:hypothetical protein
MVRGNYLSCFPENDVVEEPLNELIRDLTATKIAKQGIRRNGSLLG